MTNKTEQTTQLTESEKINNYVNDIIKSNEFFDDFKTNFITNQQLESLTTELKTQKLKKEMDTFLKMRKINEEKIIKYILEQNKSIKLDEDIKYELLYTWEKELKKELWDIYKAIDKFISWSSFITEKWLIKWKTLIIFILKNKDWTWGISNIYTK